MKISEYVQNKETKTALILEPWGENEITSDENVVPGAGIYFW